MAKSANERVGFGIQRATSTIPSGRETYWSRVYDAFREKPFTEPLPGKFKSIIESVDNGDYAALPELAIELERRDEQIAFLSESRRMALSALDWEILPNAETEDEAAAEESATYVKESLRKVGTFRQTVKHLLLAITSGVAATELVFENSELVETVDVPHTRFTAPSSGEPYINIKIDGNPQGQPMPWGKFCVWVPMQRTPYPLAMTLVHPACRLFIFKYYLKIAWMTWMEVYSVPARILFPGRKLEDADKTAAESAMKNISMDFWGILNGMGEGARLETLTPGTGGAFFEEGARWCDDALSRLYLMQTLTSDVRDSGSRALGQVHQSVRSDLLASDLMAESDNIEQNIIKPMLVLRYPGRDMPLPWFRRKMKEKKDIEAERLAIDQIRLAKENGLHIDDDVLYEKLNIPVPTTKPEESRTDQDIALTVNELTLGIERATRAGDLALVNALRERIAELLGKPLPPLGALPNATDNFGRPVGEPKPEDDPDGPQDDDEDGDEPSSIRDAVLAAIDRRWMNTKDLMKALNRPESQIRGVVTALDLRTIIERRKIGSNATQYRRRRKSR